MDLAWECLTVAVHCLVYRKVIVYTQQKYNHNTFVFAPIFHKLNYKNLDFSHTQDLLLSDFEHLFV